MHIDHKKISLPLLDLEGIVVANIKSQSDGRYLMAVDRRYIDLTNEGGAGQNILAQLPIQVVIHPRQRRTLL